MTKPHTSLLKAIAAVFLIMVLLAILETRGRVNMRITLDGSEKAVSFPVMVRADNGLRVVVSSRNTSTWYAIDLDVSGTPAIYFIPEDGSGAKLLQTVCYARDGSPGQRCSTGLPLSLSSGTLQIKPQDLDIIEVQNVSARVLRQAHLPQQGAKAIYIVFGLTLAMLPVFWLVHRNRRASEWLLIATASVALLWLQPVFAASLIAFLVVTFGLGRVLLKERRDPAARTVISSIYLTLFIAILFVVGWKYADVLLSIFVTPGGFDLFMPLGVSYFTLRVIDTVLCWNRGDLADVSFRGFLSFVLFPATISAGPIDTLDHFRKSRVERISRDDIAYGFSRLALGIAKKYLIVDLILVNAVFGEQGLFLSVALSPDHVSWGQVLALPPVLLLFAYIDFSAYSDIAVGTSRLLGYRMVENFNFPVIASSIKEFWKRWHMSLSGWCMRNIFLPAVIKTRSDIMATTLTMLAVGLWHSLSLSWFTWAIHHSAGLVVYDRLRKHFTVWQTPPMLWRGARVLITMAFVSAGYCFAFFTDYMTATAVYFRFWKALIGL